MNTLVENRTISQEKADFMLARMANADETQLQKRMGQKLLEVSIENNYF